VRGYEPGNRTPPPLLRRTLTHEHHPIEEFRVVHAARKVVGVGTVGTRCYILLLLGRDERDPLFLQIKEAQRPVLERVVGTSAYRNHGQRVVVGQRLMQAASGTDTFDRAIADFAVAYADQNERDYETFAKAVRIGRIAAPTGV